MTIELHMFQGFVSGPMLVLMLVIAMMVFDKSRGGRERRDP